MDIIRIKGGNPLCGEISISGSKNAALPILAATLLSEKPCTIKNVPDLSDIHFMVKILEHLGASVERLDTNTWRITAENINSVAPYDLVQKMRAAVCLMGPLVGRLRQAIVSLPGGCVIGPRPIDLHLKGLEKLGCTTCIKNGYVNIDATNLQGAGVFLGGRHGSTVTGTANIIMAAVLAPGITSIESAACEPEVRDLCRMLQSMGAKIEGVGSHTITIEGVDHLHGCTHEVISDRIEAGTYITAAAMTGGDVILNQVEINALGALIDKLEQAGLTLEVLGDRRLRILPQIKKLKPVDIITLPYPGFPTDMQAQMCVLMTLAPGLSIITERVYPNRFMHVPELQRMGAQIAVEGSNFIIKGGTALSGAPVMASDLRASAALILAGLAAKGVTWVQRVYHLDRGYERLDQKLGALGAQIERLSTEEVHKTHLDAVLS